MNIGKNKIGESVFWDVIEKQNVNNFALITGKSGTGKTTLCKKLVQGAAADGLAVCIIDYSGSYYKSAIMHIHPNISYINIETYGLPINPFAPQFKRVEGKLYKETNDDVTQRVTEILSAGFQLKGPKQKSLLRNSIFSALSRHGDNATFKLVHNYIEDEDLSYRLFGLDYIRTAEKKVEWQKLLKPGALTVLQISDATAYKKNIYAKLLLADLWNAVEQDLLPDCMLCLDEIQHLSFKPDSSMDKFLRESRKHRISMLLATQFIGNKDIYMKELLGQVAINFYFKPAENDMLSVSKKIDITNYKQWMKLLQNLRTGEYIFTGIGRIEAETEERKILITC